MIIVVATAITSLMNKLPDRYQCDMRKLHKRLLLILLHLLDCNSIEGKVDVAYSRQLSGDSDKLE